MCGTIVLLLVVKSRAPLWSFSLLEFEGPYLESWPPASHKGILWDSPSRKADEISYTKNVLKKFMSRAFRRDTSNAEVERMVSFYKSVRG